MGGVAKLRYGLFRLRQHRQRHGTLAMLRVLTTRIRRVLVAREPLIPPPKSSSPAVNDAIGFYSFVTQPAFGADSAAGGATVNWVIPDFGIGSGGHMTIFRAVQALENAGYTCRLVVLNARWENPSRAREAIRTHFLPLAAEVTFGAASLEPAWACVATSWETAYTVAAFRGAQKKFYFVQDYEPDFYAVGSEHFFAENTYRLGLIGITAGRWLAERLHAEFGMRTYWFGFSYDRVETGTAPCAEAPIGDGPPTVFYYARPVTPRRGFELGLLTLNEVARRIPDLHVIFAGWDVAQYRIPFSHECPGVVPHHALPGLFQRAHAGLVLSLTNVSLLPIEMMGAGCPVVSNGGPHTRWLLDDRVAELRTPTVASLSDGLERVLTDADRRRSLVANARSYVDATSWDAEMARVVAAFDAERADLSAPAGTASADARASSL